MSYTPSGNQTLVTFNGGKVQIAYDAWARPVRATPTGQVHGVTAVSPAVGFDYDALGRKIDQRTIGSTAKTQFFYDGNNVVEERDGGGSLTAQYVWAPDGTMVLRDRQVAGATAGSAGVNERVYVMHDAQGSATSIADDSGTVLERYIYDENGRPFAIKDNWSAYGYAFPVDASSRYDWQYLWHGGRWMPWYADQNSNAATDDEAPRIQPVTGGGIYDFGGQWYDANMGRAIQASPGSAALAAVTYDPTGGDNRHSGWQTYVPVWGMARDAYYDFQSGNFWTGVDETIGAGIDAALFVPGLLESTVGKVSLEGAIVIGREGTNVGLRGIAVGGIAAGSEVASGRIIFSAGGRVLGLAGRIGLEGGAADAGALALRAEAEAGIAALAPRAALAAEGEFVAAETNLVRGVKIQLNLNPSDFTLAEQAAIEYKYAMANIRIAAGLEVSEIGAQVRYRYYLSRRFVRDTLQPGTAVSKVHVPSGYQVDEFVSRQFGGRQVVPNQWLMPNERFLNNRLGPLEWAATQQIPGGSRINGWTVSLLSE